MRKPSLICLAVAISLATSWLRAQEKAPQPAAADKLQTEIKQLEKQIESLRSSPDAPPAWKEMRKVEAELDQLKFNRAKEQEPLREKLIKLANTPEVETWEDRISSISERLDALLAEDFKLTKEVGRQLFQARHAALEKTAPAETPQLKALGLDLLTYPRMDGSTSTKPLAALIACRCFGAKYSWTGREQLRRRQHSGDPTLPQEDLFFETFYESEPELRLLEFTLQAQTESPDQRRLAIIINGLLAANASTHDAYVNLIEGTSDIGLLARPPSADELKLAQEKGVELETSPVALDAFVFLVHESNPVRNLSAAQIRNIYSSKIVNWKQAGGADGQITAYQREENSGSQELMRSLVMKQTPLARPTGLYERSPQLITYLMSGIFLQLSSDEEGIGYSVYYYEHFMSGSPRTRTISVDSVEPNYENIRNRKYPFTSPVLVVTRKGMGMESPAMRLRRWLRSPEGQAVVRESGYVPVALGVER